MLIRTAFAILLMGCAPAAAFDQGFLGTWAPDRNSCRPDDNERFTISPQHIEGREMSCDLKHADQAGESWHMHYSCAGEGDTYSLDLAWRLGPDGHLLEQAGGQAKDYVRCGAAPTAAGQPAAPAAQSLPQPVQAVIDDIGQDCQPPVTVKDGFVTAKDINGDGTADYILDFGRVSCAGMASFCGTAGCETQLFVSERDGSYRSVFDDIVRDIQFARVAGRPAIKLGLHGSNCGRVGSETCYSTLYWNGSGFKPKH